MKEQSGESIDSVKKVNGTDAQGIIQPTYKKLQDADSNWKPKDESIEMSKQNGTEPDVDDGAQEKMLKDDNKVVIAPTKAPTEQVKFGSVNGETKIDIEVAKQTPSGMGKEELMKFANDPFWVRLRWFLFIGFWVLWITMLAGAITIIILAPKCTPVQPRKYIEESVMVEMDFKSTKNFGEIEKLLDSIKSKHIKTISLPPIFAGSDTNNLASFVKVDPTYGTLEDFKKLINATKERGQFIILEINPLITGLNHDWFNKSSHKDNKFNDFYIWRNKSEDSNSKYPTESNWVLSSIRNNEEYFTNDTKPRLNYLNKEVVQEMKHILSYWLDLGVYGFRFTNDSLLIEVKGQGTMEKNVKILKEFHSLVKNKTDNQGILAFKKPISNDFLEILKENNITDLLYTFQIEDTLTKSSVSLKNFASDIKKLLTEVSEWPAWDWNRLATKMKKPEEAENLMLFTMLLPGTPIVSYESIKDNTLFANFSELRTQSVFHHGETSHFLMQNDTVIAYTRIKSGIPGLLVVLHKGLTAETVDLSSLDHIPDKLKVKASSSSYAQNGTQIRTQFQSKSTVLQPESIIAMEFVPKIE